MNLSGKWPQRLIKVIFEEQGLDIKLSSFQVDEAGIGVMASGSVDVAYIGADVHKRCIEGAAQIFLQ